MNVLSLFDGISGGQVAINRAGFDISQYYASEIDKYAINITQKHFPKTIQCGDVSKLSLACSHGWFDLLIGGSPCQGFSISGKRLDFLDQRSKLVYQFIRMVNEYSPKYFLLENVRMKPECRDVISSELGVQPIEINSALVAAQSRKRLYWTNIPGVQQPKDKGILLKDIIESGIVDRDKSYCIDANYYKGGSAKCMLNNYKVNSRRQIVYQSQRRLMVDDTFLRKLSPVECERLQTLPDNYTAFGADGKKISNMQRYKSLGNGFTVDVIAHILSYIK